MIVTLRGGPFDGAACDLPYWPEALVLRDGRGDRHWYVYVDTPMEVDGMHCGVLDHARSDASGL